MLLNVTQKGIYSLVNDCLYQKSFQAILTNIWRFTPYFDEVL
jgi:hypothetical protein